LELGTTALLSLVVLCCPHREVDGVKWVNLDISASFQVQHPHDLFTWMLNLKRKSDLSYFLTHLDDTTTPRDDDDDDDDNGYNWPSVTCWAMNWATHAPPAPPLPLT